MEYNNPSIHKNSRYPIHFWKNLPPAAKTTFKLLPVILILAALPLTVWFLQFQQNLRSNAAVDCGSSLQSKIDAAATGSTLDLTGCTYNGSALISKALTLKGLTLNVPASTKGINIIADNVTLDGVKITGPQAMVYNSSEYGVYVLGSNTNRVSNLVIKNSTISRFGYGPLHIRFTENVTIENNTITDGVYAGIMIVTGAGGRISNNTIQRVGVNGASANSNNAYGIALSQQVPGTDPPTTDYVVSDNLITDVPTWHALDTHAGQRIQFLRNTTYRASRPIFITTDSLGNSATDILIKDNLFGNPSPVTFSLIGITNYKSTNATFTNNAISAGYGCPTSTNYYNCTYDYLNQSINLISIGNYIGETLPTQTNPTPTSPTNPTSTPTPTKAPTPTPTPSSAPTPTSIPSSGNTFYLEAETLTLNGSTFSVGNDTTASGGQYIAPTTGSVSTTPTREAYANVSIPTSGTYYLWARLKGLTNDSDALYLGFDTNWNRKVPSAINIWDWVLVNSYNLTSGTHTIQVGRGELNARLDRVYVTNSSTDVPGSTSTPTPTPTLTSAPTPTPIPNSTILRFQKIFLHGIGKGGDNTNPTSTGTINPLRDTRSLSVELIDSSGNTLPGVNGTITYQGSTLGYFSGDIVLPTTLSTGSYLIKVKSPQYLKKQVTGIITITKGSATTLSPLYLTTGDMDNNNSLTIADYNILTDCYSDLLPAKNCTDPAKKQAADLSDDGSVNANDYNLFLRELSVVSGD